MQLGTRTLQCQPAAVLPMRAGSRRCCRRQAARTVRVAAALDPVRQQVSAFAPATVANLGPGFDWMGCAVEVRPACCLAAPARGSAVFHHPPAHPLRSRPPLPAAGCRARATP